MPACAAPATPLRLFFADPAVLEPRAAFARAAALGFGHVILPPPWEHARHDPRIARNFSILGEAFRTRSLGDLAAAAKAEGVGLLLDVVLDRVSTEAIAGDSDAVFTIPDPRDMLDPRRRVAAGVAVAKMAGPEDALRFGTWWGAMLRGWGDEGIAGFRLTGLDAVPEALAGRLATVLRDAIPEKLLLAWTPGMSRSALASLAAARLDGVFSSLPWWDFAASWLWDELVALQAVAPVIGSAGTAASARGLAVAAAIGQGWMHDAAHGQPTPGIDLAPLIISLNWLLRDNPAFVMRESPALLSGDGGPILALLRCDAADHRSAGAAAMIVVNTDPNLPHAIRGERLLPGTGGRFRSFVGADRDAAVALTPDAVFTLPPGGSAILTATADAQPADSSPPTAEAGRMAAGAPRLAIEDPAPCVDGGRFPVKRTVGEAVTIEADILFDGHDKIAAALRRRGPGETAWQETPLRPLGNDRWAGTLPLTSLGRHEYQVLAWRDRFATFRDELAKKTAAGVDTHLELIEGEALVEAAAQRHASGPLDTTLKALSGATPEAARETLLSADLATLMQAADDRPFLVESAAIPVDAERIEARFASWYEIFPRSMSDDPTRHGNFADVERHLPRIRDMGFDVLYFPPIHPIGRKNRKGRNNTLTPAPDDPGSPYAIGSDEGGHDALHPQLGTLADFQSLRRAAAAHGLELALDFAIQCSPDHPWLAEHPGWFDWRPDGTIRYAENPPKKYEDIVNVDFYAEDAVPELWLALCRVVLFWAKQGVRLFRVDNPHTKPFPFWEWMIGEVRQRFPDAVFLAEAFTRPKIMYRLAKIGFSQSYTYFTWRNTKRELEAYLKELNEAPPRDFFRPHFFVNTPDINPVFLHDSGRPGFLIRAALAATLSGLWGLYNGFELCEARPIKPGKEEYLDSEKYEIRAWDWDRPGNIVAEVTTLNRIRRRNPALQTHLGVDFLVARNDAVLYFEKATPDRSNVVLVAVNLDPGGVQEADFEVPLWKFGLPDSGTIGAEDLLTGARVDWTGKTQRLRLTPENPYAIWRIAPAG